MIRMGKVCRHCSTASCKDMSTKEAPIEIECPLCNAAGCSECNDGYIEIDGCPNAYCQSVASVVNLADLFAKGLPPVHGGALDQSASFLEACRILTSEEAAIKAEACQPSP